MTPESGSRGATGRHGVVELTFVARERHAPPRHRLELVCHVTDPAGRTVDVPAYWAGGDLWRVRYTSGVVGRHTYRTTCAATHDASLHGRTGVIDVAEYAGANPLYEHGPVGLSPDGRRLAHADGTPFFWLGDTWWFAWTKDFRWPDVFQTLTADRVEKGFTVIQMVAGLFPEIEPADERGASEGGPIWDEGYGEINPAYFDVIDMKIDWLVRSGLVPCICGAWGPYLALAGTHKIKEHWRYLVARYGAYPVVWCIAGEASMSHVPHYLEAEADALDEARFGPWATLARYVRIQHREWSEVARYVRAIDPFRRLATVHPCPVFTYSSGDVFDDEGIYDVDMLQTGHTDRHCFESTLSHLQERLALGRKPVVNGEVCYEGILGSNWQDTQRFMFWTHMLSGAAGHTYGTFGIAVFSSREHPYLGVTRCSDATWEDSYDLPGSRQVGIGKALLERYEWQRFEPHPEWVEPHWTAQDRVRPYAAGILGRVRIFYFPGLAFLDPCGAAADWPLILRDITLRGLDDGVAYRAHFFNPRTGQDLESFDILPAGGEHRLVGLNTGATPTQEDWVLVMEE